MEPRRTVLAAVFSATALLVGCTGARQEEAAPPEETAPAVVEADVSGTVETAPVPNDGDAADDPALWIDRDDPSSSTVIGTDKLGGLAVYDLAGRQIQYLPAGKTNNVDVRTGLSLGGETVSLVTAADRSDDSIIVYEVDEDSRKLRDVSARTIEAGIGVYGVCMYLSPSTGEPYVFVTSEEGEIEQWRLFDDGGGKVDAERVRSFDVGSKTEGCVADDRLGHLYLAEEARGVWKYGAETGAGTGRTLVDSTGSGGHLEADVEGLAIAYGAGDGGYLIASSQGDSSYVAYERAGGNDYVKTFTVGPGDGIDGVENTDGIDVTTTDLGPDFPHGVFVVQDGKNDGGNQNFKLVPLERIFP